MQNTIFLTPEALASRWNIKKNTLGQWRWNGKGPKFNKINKVVLYPLDEVERFESQKLMSNTSQYTIQQKEIY